jgi:hypothetical protein
MLSCGKLAVIASSALLAGAPAALADSRELYTLASLALAVAQVREPGAGGSIRLGGALELSALYGLDNQWHLGGSLRLGGLKNASFPSTNVTLSDGSTYNGVLYEDSLQVGVTLAAAYRFDVGPRWAPVVRADIGISLSSYLNRLVIASRPAPGPPSGASLATARAIAPNARIALFAQRRFGEEVVLEAGLSLRGELGDRGGVQLEFPITIGWIF